MIVVNLFAGPGVGKSTLAAQIFSTLKINGINAEMALEYAKDKVYEESFRTMDDQLYIFAKQFHKIWRLRDKVDVVICDSPLPFSIVYNKETSRPFNELVMEQFNNFNNLNFFIERKTKYETFGRTQTEEEAIELDKEILKTLNENNINFTTISNISTALDIITNEILAKIG